jgi:uncharacterized phiE125 gp8 family phage protein
MDAIAPLAAAALPELKDWLRIALEDEDILLTGHLAAAIGLCEQFTAMALLRRAGDEELPVCGDWMALAVRPVTAITAVDGAEGAGPFAPLTVDAYAVDIAVGGTGRVRIEVPCDVTRLRVRYLAGLTESWAGLPETVRHGIIRLAAHFYAGREGDAAIPSAVTALWRPWRKLSL